MDNCPSVFFNLKFLHMKFFLLTLSLLFIFVIKSYSQYIESFDVNNKGIILGPCAGSTGTTCASNDFSSVDWTIEGNLTGIDSEGLFTKSGYLHFEDVDEESCWVSPLLNISSLPSVSFNIEFTIPSGTSWESSNTIGSSDYMDVKYSTDGGMTFTTIPNVNGCPASGHTVSGVNCSGLTGPLTFNVSETGISGSSLIIQVCVDTNASSDDGWLQTVSVPEAGVVLPVTWSDIDVKETARGPKLEWSTGSEIDSDLFEIQRLNFDTDKFESIGQVQAAGYSSTERYYEFNDQDYVYNNILYYRIKQVDFNGEYSYSEVVSIKMDKDEHSDVSIYPNPTYYSIQIDAIDSFKENIGTIKIYNTLGALEKEIDYTDLNKNSAINISSLSSGIYFIQFVDKNEVSLGEIIRIYKLDAN